MKLSSLKKHTTNNSIVGHLCKDMKVSPLDEGLTPTKDGGTCLRRLSMFRKEVH